MDKSVAVSLCGIYEQAVIGNALELLLSSIICYVLWLHSQTILGPVYPRILTKRRGCGI